MKKLLAKLRAHGERKRSFLREAREKIAQTNMSTLRYASLLTVIVLIVLLALAKLLLQGWEPTLYHCAMLPASLALCIAAWTAGGRLLSRMGVILLEM